MLIQVQHTTGEGQIVVFWSKSFFINLNVCEATVMECERNNKLLRIHDTEGHQKPKRFKKLNCKM